jgi:hypothetical protein
MPQRTIGFFQSFSGGVRFRRAPIPDSTARENARLETLVSLCYPTAMKMTFAIPDELGRRFREAVPAGERSAVVTDFLRKKFRPSEASLEAVCGRVNKLKRLEQEMADWERFDDQAP